MSEPEHGETGRVLRHPLSVPSPFVEESYRRLLDQGYEFTTPQALCAKSRSGDIEPDTFERFANPTTHPKPWQSLRYPQSMTDAATLRLHGLADYNGVCPLVQAFVARYIERLRKQGVPMYVHSAFLWEHDIPDDGPAQRGAQVVFSHVHHPFPFLCDCEREWLLTQAAMALETMRRQRKAPDLIHVGSLTFVLRNWEARPLVDPGPAIRRTPRKLLRNLGNGS